MGTELKLSELALLRQRKPGEGQFLTTEDVPGSVRSDDKDFQAEWKETYCAALHDYHRGHNKIFCGDDNRISKHLQLVHTGHGGEMNCYRWMPASSGVYRRFIYVGNREETAAQILVIDVDAKRCWTKWKEWGLPCPHLEVINPESQNVQWHYLLAETCYDMKVYHRVVATLTALVQDGKDYNGNKNLQYRSPFLKVNGKRKNGRHLNSKGKLQAAYALVIAHASKPSGELNDAYSLLELVEGLDLDSVETTDAIESAKQKAPRQDSNITLDMGPVPGNRNNYMFEASWKVCCQKFRDNGGFLTYDELFAVYTSNGSDLPVSQIEASARGFEKWLSGNKERVLKYSSSSNVIGIVNPPTDFHSADRQRARVNKRWEYQREFVGETKTEAAARFGVSRVTFDKWIRLGKVEMVNFKWAERTPETPQKAQETPTETQAPTQPPTPEPAPATPARRPGGIRRAKPSPVIAAFAEQWRLRQQPG